jgi:hypothetical protein
MDKTIKEIYTVLLSKKGPQWNEPLQGRVTAYIRLYEIIQLTTPVIGILVKYNTAIRSRETR